MIFLILYGQYELHNGAFSSRKMSFDTVLKLESIVPGNFWKRNVGFSGVED